jgi:hypothetical protein
MLRDTGAIMPGGVPEVCLELLAVRRAEQQVLVSHMARV